VPLALRCRVAPPELHSITQPLTILLRFLLRTWAPFLMPGKSLLDAASPQPGSHTTAGAAIEREPHPPNNRTLHSLLTQLARPLGGPRPRSLEGARTHAVEAAVASRKSPNINPATAHYCSQQKVSFVSTDGASREPMPDFVEDLRLGMPGRQRSCHPLARTVMAVM
jgi:hypothetical protein